MFMKWNSWASSTCSISRSPGFNFPFSASGAFSEIRSVESCEKEGMEKHTQNKLKTPASNDFTQVDRILVSKFAAKIRVRPIKRVFAVKKDRHFSPAGCRLS